MGALALASDEAEVFDRPSTGRPEPVRGASVELGGLASLQEQILVAEHQSEGAVQHIGPVEPFMGAQVWDRIVSARREDELERLDTAWATCERDDDRPVTTGHGTEIDSRIGGARRVDKGIQGDAVITGQRE